MHRIFIGSTGDHAGLTLTTWAIARRLLEKKYNPGFFKPFGIENLLISGAGTDPDVLLFKEILNISEPAEMICPYEISGGKKIQGKPIQVLDKIKYHLSILSKHRDVLLIEGSRDIFSDGAPNVMRDLSLVAEINADLILVHRFQKMSTSLYSILSIHSLFKDRLKGVVVNRVSSEQLENIRDKMIPLLNQKGILNIAVLPEHQFLSTRSIKEIVEILSGKVICCKEYIDRTVTALTVGTSCLHQELRIFKRVYNKIILLGPASGCPEIAGIILTGNREIPNKVLKIAQEAKIPVILVKKDIFTNFELLEKNISKLSPKDENKVIHFTEMLDHNDFLNRLIMSLGVEL